jgi:hypothetical protein
LRETLFVHPRLDLHRQRASRPRVVVDATLSSTTTTRLIYSVVPTRARVTSRRMTLLMFSSCFDARGKLTRHTLTRECHKPNRRTTERRKEINITMSDVWTTKLRATRQLLNELRADAANGFSAEDAHGNTKASTSNQSSSADADRARRVAVTRRKLNRLDDLLDVLEDCVGEGAENDEDIRAREETVNAFQREARELRGALNREPTISAANANDRGGHAAKSTTSANVQAFGAADREECFVGGDDGG